MSVETDSLSYDFPVKVCTDCESDRGPACVCDTGKICKTRKSHKEPAAHIGGFCTHCGYQRTKLTTAQIQMCAVVINSSPF